jgi:PPK2 family polyphosphate:nucleotide phosphotransferase
VSKQKHEFDHGPFSVPHGTRVRLADYDPKSTDGLDGKKQAKDALASDRESLAHAQERLWASADRAVLIIFQALDAAGKDSAIKHVMSGVNPQGCEVHSFKAPSEEERRHPFLWRPVRFLPGRGRIAIFNRSYYEEVLVVRVHPRFLDDQWLPIDIGEQGLDKLWQQRYEQINAFEKTLEYNNTTVIKFFLNVSKEEQKERFLERLQNPEKHWKFNADDIRERGHWNEYIAAYEDMLSATSTAWAPWYIIPADKKWFTRACIADIITRRIGELNLTFPQTGPEQKKELEKAKQELLDE